MMTEGAVSVGIIGGLVSLELTRVLADGEDPLPTKDIRWWAILGLNQCTACFGEVPRSLA